jgi:hypothetical protein
MAVEVSRFDQDIIDVVDEFCLFDDDFMSLVFDKNVEAAELLLNVILEREDIKVIEVIGQREYKNPVVGGRSIRIDIYAEDSSGKIYDIEVQREDAGADVHRARFNSSMLDTRMLRKKQNFKELHDSYVIFITENDVMGEGFPLYHVDRTIRENGKGFGDGSHIIYVNGEYRDDTNPVGKLMHDFWCRSAENMIYPQLAKQVSYYKKTEGGRLAMSSAVDRIAEKIAEKRRLETLFNSVSNLMETMKLTVEQAMDALKISESDRESLMKRF